MVGKFALPEGIEALEHSCVEWQEDGFESQGHPVLQLTYQVEDRENLFAGAAGQKHRTQQGDGAGVAVAEGVVPQLPQVIALKATDQGHQFAPLLEFKQLPVEWDAQPVGQPDITRPLRMLLDQFLSPQFVESGLDLLGREVAPVRVLETQVRQYAV